MLAYALSGMLLGLTAGLSPGPLLWLTIAETLRHGSGQGVRVALAPLLTDLPIVAAALLLLQGMAGLPWMLGGIGLAGALYLLHLAWGTWRSATQDVTASTVDPHSLRRGLLVNALSPHPYLFWLAVGGPLLLQAAARSTFRAALFVAAFYVCLVGSKAGVALLVGRCRGPLKGIGYRIMMRILALSLLGLALVLAHDALLRLGLLG
jgi:threonine/homoserine/homoserine lactone efflux protein